MITFENVVFEAQIMNFLFYRRVIFHKVTAGELDPQPLIP